MVAGGIGAAGIYALNFGIPMAAGTAVVYSLTFLLGGWIAWRLYRRGSGWRLAGMVYAFSLLVYMLTRMMNNSCACEQLVS